MPGTKRKKQIDLLPPEARKILKEQFDPVTVEVVPDPKVDGVFALRCTSPEGEEYHLLWTHGDFDEIEFTQWPPVSGEPRFFI